MNTKEQKAILKAGLQNEVRPHIVSLKEAVKEGNKLLKEILDKEQPVGGVNFAPVIEKLNTLTEEVKKKEEYAYEIKVDADLKRKLTGKQGIRGARGLRGLQGKAGKDGKTPTVDVTGIKKAVTPIKGKDYFDGKQGEKGADGKNGTTISPTEIRNKLESLKGKQRLKMSAIQGLEEHLNKSAGAPIGASDGGTGGGAGGSSAWGGITGDINTQADLQAEFAQQEILSIAYAVAL